MGQLLPACCLVLALGQAPGLHTRFVQVAPTARASEQLVRSPGQTRAVVLIHGLTLWPPRKGEGTPPLHSYQRPDAPLVQRLASEADVFAFAYEQPLPVTQYAGLPILSTSIRYLHQLGYNEVVVVGFSAGGLIARQLVEDLPTSGVSKVIQVDTPNLGSGWASASHDPFRHSLSPKARREFLQHREGKHIPEMVQFVCVVGSGLIEGDGVVSVRSQWPPDLQQQGIPARGLGTTHLRAPRGQAGVRLIAELVQEAVPRANAAEIAAMKPKIQRLASLHHTGVQGTD